MEKSFYANFSYAYFLLVSFSFKKLLLLNLTNNNFNST